MLHYEPGSFVFAAALYQAAAYLIESYPVETAGAVGAVLFLLLVQGAIREWLRQLHLLVETVGATVRPALAPATATLAVAGLAFAIVRFDLPSVAKSIANRPALLQAAAMPVNEFGYPVIIPPAPVLPPEPVRTAEAQDQDKDETDERGDPLPVPVNVSAELADAAHTDLPEDAGAAALVMNARAVIDQDPVQAVDLLERARRRSPEEAVIWRELARAYDRIDGTEAADAALAMAQDLEPAAQPSVITVAVEEPIAVVETRDLPDPNVAFDSPAFDKVPRFPDPAAPRSVDWADPIDPVLAARPSLDDLAGQMTDTRDMPTIDPAMADRLRHAFGLRVAPPADTPATDKAATDEADDRKDGNIQL